MAEAKKKESTLKTVKDVIFVYSSVCHPQKQLNKDNKAPLSDHALEFHGYEIKILVTETVFKALKKAFKGAKNFPNVKEYTPEEVVTLLGEDWPEPDEDMVLIKFTQGCLFGKKGSRKEARKVGLVGSKKSVNSDGTAFFDNKGMVITSETSIGNGSKGHLQFNPVENEFGVYLYPTAVCITDLVEYVSNATTMDEDAFGIEESDEFADDSAPTDTASPEVEDDFADDIPF